VQPCNRAFLNPSTLVSRLVISHMESSDMTSERSGDIYLTLTHIMILNRWLCRDPLLVSTGLPSGPVQGPAVPPTRGQAYPPPSSPCAQLSSLSRCRSLTVIFVNQSHGLLTVTNPIIQISLSETLRFMCGSGLGP
jgi:hypothetical protein